MDYVNFLTSITTSTIVTGLVTVALNSWIKGKINLNYDKKIEKFKDALAELSQNRKLDFERKIHDFSLYSSKKHEIYPELYKLLLSIKRIAIQCNVENEIPISLKDNQKALNIYLIDMGVPEEKRNELLYNWDKNKSLYEMGKTIFILKVNELSNFITKTRDYFFTNEIYMSEDLATKVEFFLMNSKQL